MFMLFLFLYDIDRDGAKDKADSRNDKHYRLTAVNNIHESLSCKSSYNLRKADGAVEQSKVCTH